ncbi:MAG TPA: hypothetical protein PKL78_10245 [Anaerolineales bacterium]|nr:hypothetical protein [Anaerolineales bacterium]HNN13930.1 hypothetical protein [Anaerolineales bacterium]
MQTTKNAPNPIQQAYETSGMAFYSIATMAAINAFICYLWISSYFPIGLGVTQVIAPISHIFQENPDSAQLMTGILLYLAIVAAVAVFGFFIKKQNKPALVAASALYLLDTILVILLKDYLALAFHGYFLYRLWLDWQVITKQPQSAVESM